jgi:hypothetical protein
MRRLWRSTTAVRNVPRITKKTKLRELVVERSWSRIGDAEWDVVRAEIPGIAPEDLQSLEVPVDAPWSGVRQHTADELAQSLCALTEVYCTREDLRRFCRSTVILAKDRARWASRNPRVDQTRQQVKAEMVDWMLVWLGDPAVFPAWLGIRRTRASAP